MTDFDTFPNLADPTVADAIAVQMADTIREDAVADAGRFILNMAKLLRTPPNDQLRTANPELYANYEELLAQARMLALPSCSEREAVDLFERHFLQAYLRLRTEVNIANKIHGLMVGTPGFAARDELKRALRAALQRNGEVFASGMLPLEGRDVPQTVGNWLRYYLAVVGAAPAKGSLARAEFFQRDRNILALASDQQQVLHEIIEFFDDLSLSSLTPEGLEDRVTVVVDGKLQLYRGGYFEDLEKSEAAKVIRRLAAVSGSATAAPTAPVEPASAVSALASARTPVGDDRSAAIVAAYCGDPAQAQAVAAQQQRLVSLGGDSAKLAAEFFRAVQRSNVAGVHAALLVLAATGQLPQLLATDEKLRAYLMAVWPKTYGPASAAAFASDPRSWQSVRLLLQYVLQERLRLPEGEAARIGAQVGNALQRSIPGKYSAFAYYDVTAGEFRWMGSEAGKSQAPSPNIQ